MGEVISPPAYRNASDYTFPAEYKQRILLHLSPDGDTRPETENCKRKLMIFQALCIRTIFKCNGVLGEYDKTG